MTTEELLARIKEAQHEAAALYGFTPQQWDHIDYRMRTATGGKITHHENELYGAVLNKASEIMRGKKVYR